MGNRPPTDWRRYFKEYDMRFLLCLALCFCASVASADTNIYARRVAISSAQADAESMARTGVLRHCGTAGGRREGIGFSTAGPDAAERNCCFYGRYKIVERGVAYSPVRRGWFAVIRYGN
jgi:hypothetical protein